MVAELPVPLGAGKFNVYTGTPTDTPGAKVPTIVQLGLQVPRFCAECGRRMVVQLRPHGWHARCSRHGEVDSTELEQR